LSTLRYFRKEYERHVWDKKCDAFVCKGVVGASCQSACPIGTEAWRYVAHIAWGAYDQAYQVIRQANPFPSVCARVCNQPCESRCRAGATGSKPVAIRALKRFITDHSDPATYRPVRAALREEAPPVAIVGAGPAGLTAAHYLSLMGYRVTVFESEGEPGGMLFSAIPGYRLPREVMRQEIAALIDENITLKCNTTLGRDVTLDSLFAGGFGAVFVALGAHKSLRLGLDGEDATGIIPSIRFLKAFNMRGEELARGRVGVVGGGNSALDAARMALRQKDVKSVTIIYRRTQDEMPAFPEEIEAAIHEGVKLEVLTTPIKIHTRDGKLTGIECIKNRLGDLDASGRRKPLPIQRSEHTIPLDTLIVAVSEGSDTDCVSVAGANRLEVNPNGTVRAEPESLATNRPGVFAGGDVVTGPNTVVDAIASGKKAAVVIDRYLSAEPLIQPAETRLPRVYIAPPPRQAEEIAPTDRVEVPRLPVQARRRSFAEVEMTLSFDDATREAMRCLRCDLAFTEPKRAEELVPAQAGGAA
ncbi:MAG: FAD-dependent oxidoreductase, partial [Acidobacteriota bacterium]